MQVRGATESFIAYCDGEVHLGEAVLVASSRGDRSVEVYPVNQLRVPPRTPPSRRTDMFGYRIHAAGRGAADLRSPVPRRR